MATVTPNYGFYLPVVNSPTDEDLWGDLLNENFSTLDTDLKTVADAAAAAAAAVQNMYPVGSIYINATNATNPATLLGFGTWVAFGQGRVILGAGTSSADTNGETLTVAAGATGGEFNHTLTTSEIPSHSHTTNGFLVTGGSNGVAVFSNGLRTDCGTGTGNTGGGLKHNNVQPWIGCYVWRRTA